MSSEPGISESLPGKLILDCMSGMIFSAVCSRNLVTTFANVVELLFAISSILIAVSKLEADSFTVVWINSDICSRGCIS